MGGNAKHMPHIWEHLDHTFEDVVTLLEDLTSGSLPVTEKFDGVNIHFRVDNTGVVKFSRNETEKNAGGIPFSSILEVFASHPAREVFIEGCRAIDEYFSGVWWPFGHSGRNWINAEIVYSPRPQLLKYDKNAIVLHEVVTFLPQGKKLVESELQRGLEKVCPQTPVATITGFEWTVLPPQPVNLVSRCGEGFLAEALNRLDVCRQTTGLASGSTLRDFLRESLFHGVLANIKINSGTRAKLADHISGKVKHRLIDLKKGLPRGVASQVSEVGQVKNRDKVHREAMAPIISTLSAFGSFRMTNLSSALIENGSTEVVRLQEEIDGARQRIMDSDDADAQARLDLFEGFMSEYDMLGGSPPAIEGVTFSWKEKKTKLTGVFATLNQAVGVDRYGRGSVGPTPRKTEKFNLAEWFGIV